MEFHHHLKPKESREIINFVNKGLNQSQISVKIKIFRDKIRSCLAKVKREKNRRPNLQIPWIGPRITYTYDFKLWQNKF